MEARGLLQRPTIPADCEHNGHMYYVLVDRRTDRDAVLDSMRADGVIATFHYVPLHSAPAGGRSGRAVGDLSVTIDSAARLVRLPIWCGLAEAEQLRVVETLGVAIKKHSR